MEANIVIECSMVGCKQIIVKKAEAKMIKKAAWLDGSK